MTSNMHGRKGVLVKHSSYRDVARLVGTGDPSQSAVEQCQQDDGCDYGSPDAPAMLMVSMKGCI